MTNAKNASETSPAREFLNRKENGTGPHPLRPLDHLAFAIMIDGGADAAESLNAISKLYSEFVDWNEIRVARTQELARRLGELPNAERAALRIKEEYNSFFDKKGSLSFEFLAAGKPAETRRMLGQLLPHLSKGAVSLLLFEFCAGASLPLSDEALKLARKEGIVGKTGDRNQLARALGDVLEPGEAAFLVQHLELEATGNPYGDAGKRDGKAGTAKKGKKTTVKKTKPAR